MSGQQVQRTSSSGFGLGTVLFIVFLVMKLTGLIAWSWWWVTAPLWIPALFVIVVLGLIAIIAAAVGQRR